MRSVNLLFCNIVILLCGYDVNLLLYTPSIRLAFLAIRHCNVILSSRSNAFLFFCCAVILFPFPRLMYA
jgi:hypothetical protein